MQLEFKSVDHCDLNLESEFNEFDPHLKSTNNRFQLSDGSNSVIVHRGNFLYVSNES